MQRFRAQDEAVPNRGQIRDAEIGGAASSPIEILDYLARKGAWPQDVEAYTFGLANLDVSHLVLFGDGLGISGLAGPADARFGVALEGREFGTFIKAAS